MAVWIEATLPVIASAGIEQKLAAIDAAIAALEYSAAAEDLRILVGDPALNDEQRLRVHMQLGCLERILGRDADSRGHFLYVLRRRPDAVLIGPGADSPRVQNYFALVRDEITPLPPSAPPMTTPATTPPATTAPATTPPATTAPATTPPATTPPATTTPATTPPATTTPATATPATATPATATTLRWRVGPAIMAGAGAAALVSGVAAGNAEMALASTTTSAAGRTSLRDFGVPLGITALCSVAGLGAGALVTFIEPGIEAGISPPELGLPLLTAGVGVVGASALVAAQAAGVVDASRAPASVRSEYRDVGLIAVGAGVTGAVILAAGTTLAVVEVQDEPDR
jgi:hypothetical protein